ncbi:MAG TPA: RNA polymerase subunit sigma-70 [Planctomycetaceae bacterium]|nr:RNA polymerase subunit sigma-70 [Planctomycetaceae bacterium]
MDITQILKSAADGDPDAKASVIEAAYDRLRRMAARQMSQERQDHTLTATALVHEVSAKFLADQRALPTDRAAFLGFAATAMRNLLVDHARTKGRQKRGGDRKKLAFEEAFVAAQEQSEDFLALNQAIQDLADAEPRKAKVVELRYFGGLSNQQVADALSISLATVKRDWEVARTWLMHELRTTESD